MGNNLSREILFRAKSNDWLQDRWVEGCLIHANDYCCILESEEYVHPMDYPYLDAGLGTFDGRATPVNPNTVGQYTGLTDKNGKRIFEGDLVRAERIGNGDEWFGSVVWWNGCFAIQGVKDRNVPAIDLFREYEVIGNIHDNPELLEVAQ